MDEFEKDFTETSSSQTNAGIGKKADKGERIVAAFIDMIIASILFGIFRNPLGGGLSMAYMLTRDALPFLEGQSIGKKLLKLRAVKDNGKPLTDDWGSSVIRNIPLIIPVVSFIELIVYLTNEKEQRLGDQFAHTHVVKE